MATKTAEKENKKNSTGKPGKKIDPAKVKDVKAHIKKYPRATPLEIGKFWAASWGATVASATATAKRIVTNPEKY